MICLEDNTRVHPPFELLSPEVRQAVIRVPEGIGERHQTVPHLFAVPQAIQSLLT